MTLGRHDSGTSSIHTNDVGLTSMWNVNSHQWRQVDIWAKFGHCHCCCCCCCRCCSSNINNHNDQVWPKCQPDVIDVNSHRCQSNVIGVNWRRPRVMTSRRHRYHEIDQSPTKRSDCLRLMALRRPSGNYIFNLNHCVKTENRKSNQCSQCFCFYCMITFLKTFIHIINRPCEALRGARPEA